MEYVDDYLGAISQTSIRQVSEVANGYTSFQDRDVLFAKITPCMENGKCAIARNLENGIGFGSTEFHVVRAGDEIIPEWVYYYLRQEVVRKEAERNMTGSAGQKRVPSKFLVETLIPLPPLDEQKRIADILSKADRLRQLRRYTRELSDGYLQSVFLEMFGNVRTHIPLGKLVTITGGGTPSRNVKEYYEGHIPWLTSKDMIADYITDTQEHVTKEAIRKSATKLVPAGSILVVVKSKILMRRLPLAITKVPLCHGQDIKSIQCSEKVLPEFLVYVLKHHSYRLLHQARGANTEGLTLPMLREVPVPDVSFDLQQKFAHIVQKYESLRAQQREAERQAEHLFQSLLDRAFKGATEPPKEVADTRMKITDY
jgi:type I restriction enzyme S subunit